MPISLPQNFYVSKLALAADAGAVNFYVSTPPTNDSGFLVISPRNAAKREIVKFTAKGSDGNGDFVTVTLANRGLGGTTDQAHSVDEPVYMNVVDQHFVEVRDAIQAISNNGALPATDTTQGTVQLSVPADIPTSPVALGENDPRVPSTEGGEFLASVTGMMIPFAGRLTPAGFLLCDGQAISPTTYPNLYEAIRNDYGLGDGEEVTAENGTDLITRINHGYSNDDRFFISSNGGDIPAGFDADVAYFVVNATNNNFQLATESGGTPVDFSDDGTGTLTVHPTFRVPNAIGRVIVSEGTSTYRLDIDTTTQIDTVGLGVLNRNSNYTNDNIHQMFEPGTNNVNAFQTGDQIMLNTSSFSNLSANTIYYAIPVGTAVRFATSYANAQSNSFIQLSSQSVSCDVHRPAVFDLGSSFTGVIENGTEVELSEGDGTLPANLPAGTYYAIKVTPTQIKLTDTLAKAQAGNGALLAQTTFGEDNGTGTINMVIQGVQYVLGQEGGAEYVVLTEAQLPSHNHDILDPQGPDLNATELATQNSNSSFSSTNTIPDVGASVGGDEPHENRMPYVVAKYIIKT